MAKVDAFAKVNSPGLQLGGIELKAALEDPGLLGIDYAKNVCKVLSCLEQIFFAEDVSTMNGAAQRQPLSREFDLMVAVLMNYIEQLCGSLFNCLWRWG